MSLRLLWPVAEDSIIGARAMRAILLYLVLSTAAALLVVTPKAPLALKAAAALLLLGGFLMLTRLAVSRVSRLDEFGQMLAWRAFAAAGLVAVWFELFLGVLFHALGFDLLVVVALGPPEFWLCAALFIRQAERAYAGPRTS